VCLRACAYTDREVFFFFRNASACAAASNLDFFPPPYVDIGIGMCVPACARVSACVCARVR